MAGNLRYYCLLINLWLPVYSPTADNFMMTHPTPQEFVEAASSDCNHIFNLQLSKTQEQERRWMHFCGVSSNLCTPLLSR
jgi:hypothetical protein